MQDHSLAIQTNREMQTQTFLILFDVYKEGSRAPRRFPPYVDELYRAFVPKWIDEMYDFISANADVFMLDSSRFGNGNVTDLLAEIGFPVPSHIEIHAALNALELSYMTNAGYLVNGAVIGVW